MLVDQAAGPALATGISKYFRVHLKHTGARRRPAAITPLAALRRMDHRIQLSKNDCQAPLLELNSAACFFKLFLEVFSVVFRSTFLNG
jgi:hypothetical protein